jgi:hypothetical protein
MLGSGILRRKRTYLKSARERITDFIHSTFKFVDNKSGSGGIIGVAENESMRPDLVADRVYGDQSKWDVILKYNGISNPFSIQTGDLMFAIPFSAIEASYKNPRILQERGEKAEGEFSPILDPKTKKDRDRLNNLQKKVGEVVPPNVNRTGDTNVKVKDGRVIFGEDVTSVNKENCPVPISRARLQTALLKDKLFI